MTPPRYLAPARRHNTTRAISDSGLGNTARCVLPDTTWDIVEMKEPLHILHGDVLTSEMYVQARGPIPSRVPRPDYGETDGSGKNKMLTEAARDAKDGR